MKKNKEENLKKENNRNIDKSEVDEEEKNRMNQPDIWSKAAMSLSRWMATKLQQVL